MIEIEVRLLNGIHEKLSDISDILSLDFDKVLKKIRFHHGAGPPSVINQLKSSMR